MFESPPRSKMIRHLQIALTPAEYQTITQRYQRRGVFSRLKAEDDYWEHVPTYLIARCPLCAATYREKLDTYNLVGWRIRLDNWKSIYVIDDNVRRFDEKKRMERLAKQGKLSVQKLRKLKEFRGYVPKSAPQQIDCTHFVGVQTFLNLNKVVPNELDYFSNESESEVPFVIPDFLPDDIESYVVMHSLPICRIEENQFVPRYAMYMLTYYSARPHWLRERFTERYRGGGGGEGYFLVWEYAVSQTKRLSEAWNLAMWVGKRKLLWLDLEEFDLPLRNGPVADFPYSNIEGMRWSYTYRKGKLEPGFF